MNLRGVEQRFHPFTSLPPAHGPGQPAGGSACADGLDHMTSRSPFQP